ncbi:unnamed protein product [Chondrus crispus]|uniref:Uncharacterized protein n=1 Tax=Chondrus crispus TaxID=2769 RepID=R7QDX9_CHOCR|nr:unnamed protein product [Chondrus crispus]CDF35630.1 unnamed protein product [Chondrus crispus]|eukprot:XP_005715449.1 unnamed protein product [Chondrus crispus]
MSLANGTSPFAQSSSFPASHTRSDNVRGRGHAQGQRTRAGVPASEGRQCLRHRAGAEEDRRPREQGDGNNKGSPLRGDLCSVTLPWGRVVVRSFVSLSFRAAPGSCPRVVTDGVTPGAGWGGGGSRGDGGGDGRRCGQEKAAHG